MWLKADRVTPEDVKEIPLTLYKQIDNHRIAYRDIGKGKVVFCLPPWPSSSAVYIPLALAMKDSIRTIAIDLPGWGGYSGKLHGEPTIDTFTDIIVKFINSFGLENFSILGYSFGGVFCQHAMYHPGFNPEKVVFVSTLHSGKALETANHFKIGAMRTALKYHIPSFIMKRVVAGIMMRHVSKGPYYVCHNTVLYKTILAEDWKADIKTAARTLLSLLSHDVLAEQPDLPMQTLLLYADRDLPMIRTESRDMAEALGITPLLIENADHDHLPFDVNKSADIILNFLLA